MSSTLPVLPATAPFSADQITALNSVMAGTNQEQRSWLSGFLAGYQAGTGAAQAVPAPVAAPAAPPAARVPLTILYATESGNSEALARAARKQAQKLGFAPRVVDMADTTPEEVAAGATTLLVIASTWGEGDPPQRAAEFLGALMGEAAPRFEGVRFAVLALGDRAYVNFCQTGREIDARLAALGGARAAEHIECDLDYEAAAAGWIERALPALKPEDPDGAVIHVDFARVASVEESEAPRWTRTAPFAAEIATLQQVTGSRSTSRTMHVELSLADSGISYEPGDAIGVMPENDPALVDDVLATTGLAGDAALREALRTQYDINTLTPAVAARLAPGMDVRGRHLIDALETARPTLAAEELRGLLRPLPARLYSVASSQKAVEAEAHLLISAVGWESFGRARKGVASRFVADRRGVGDQLRIFVKPNPHFRLPADPARRVIMVGPGTGVAPFRAFMQEREAVGARGESWLFFGHRNYTHDFLYQLEWQEWLQSGVLNRIDVAFSRDQPEKVYVQHRLWERRRELFAWLEEGAALYVCGDANAMAKDVHATLLRIVADAGVADAEAYVRGLQKSGRYLRDVY